MAMLHRVVLLAALASMSTTGMAFRIPLARLRATNVLHHVSRHRAGLSLSSVRMQVPPPGDDERWASGAEIDESKEKLESVKAAGLALVTGSLAWFYPSNALSAQWELAHDGLALMCALFGLVYRYAVRQDQNPQLKQGVVGAFVITRSWAMLQVDPSCTPVPLQCGAPLGYFNWNMIAQGTGAAVELWYQSGIAFGVAALALEFAFKKGFGAYAHAVLCLVLRRCMGIQGWVGRFPSA